MDWLLALVVSCAFAGFEATPLEDLIDEMIYELNADLLSKHQDVMEIPGINEKLEKKILGHKFHVGDFKGEGGWFKNVSTIRRTGSLDMEQRNTSTSLGVSMGLGDAEFGFEYYHIKMLGVGLHGKLRASVGKNSVHAQLTMEFPETGPCKTTIDKLEIPTLEKFDVKLTGLGKIPDKFYSFVAKLLANGYHRKIASVASEKLLEVAEQVLAKKDICNQFLLQ